MGITNWLFPNWNLIVDLWQSGCGRCGLPWRIWGRRHLEAQVSEMHRRYALAQLWTLHQQSVMTAMTDGGDDKEAEHQVERSKIYHEWYQLCSAFYSFLFCISNTLVISRNMNIGLKSTSAETALSLNWCPLQVERKTILLFSIPGHHEYQSLIS